MNLDAEMNAALQTFLVESQELLQDMEQGLLNVETEADPTDSINAIFRAAHTIKGSAGLFGLHSLVAFTHVVESVLDCLREGKIAISTELIAALLPCCDHIAVLIDCSIEGNAEDPDVRLAGDFLLQALQVFLPGSQSKVLTPTKEAPAVVETIGSDKSHLGGNWHLSLRFGIDCLRDGLDPLAFIRYLSTLGEIVLCTTLYNSMPNAEDMEAESCYLGFEIEFKSQATKAEIENVFEFVRESSTIRILPLDSGVDAFIALIKELPEEDSFLGELLVKCGALTRLELDLALTQQTETLGNQRLGEILVENTVLQQPIVNAALDKQKQVKESKSRENKSIRIDSDRLDKLIDLVGELVISGAGVNLRAPLTGDVQLMELTGEVMRLIEEVRDSALQLRMVPISTVFSRFQRVVRDVSKELNKDIELSIQGGETEVDKSVVEKIADPLMHLVRNSMDHGIENAELRRERGKSPTGKLSLNAYHSSGSIVIEVSDDGGGLNRERILAKAIERGMIANNAHLSDSEVYALIFEPGFSTAQQLSNLSGRGVGMDVVKRNVTALRGQIEVESQSGIGSTMRIHLPLTLAIIDGFLVSVGLATFVIPLDRVIECVALPVEVERRDYMDLRGEVLPLIRLHSLFDIKEDELRRKNVVVVEYAGNKAGIIVDQLLGEFQTVIKPLGKLFSHIRSVAGSTILGTGKVALILDVSSLVDVIDRKTTHANKALTSLSV